MARLKFLFMFNLFILIFISFNFTNVTALEATKVVSNSENWEDVYSVMLYSSLTNTEGYFLTST